MAVSPYPIDPQLTGLAIAYKNTEYIADEIAPYRPVSKQLFEWDEYAIQDMFTQPNTRVGRLSRPNQVTFSATRNTDTCEDYALDSPVPNRDIENADANQDPLAHAVEGTMELVKLDREIRVAETAQALASYLSTQRATLSGTAQFSDFTNSDPKSLILAALDACLIRPNHLGMGQAAWTVLRQHTKLVKAIKGNDTGEGAITKEELADLLEIERVIVGVGWKNSAKPGQAFAKARVWGKHIWAAHINPQAQLTGTVGVPTWMMTARFGTAIASQNPDPNIGMLGGINVRAGESVYEMICSQQGAYLWRDAVA